MLHVRTYQSPKMTRHTKKQSVEHIPECPWLSPAARATPDKQHQFSVPPILSPGHWQNASRSRGGTALLGSRADNAGPLLSSSGSPSLQDDIATPSSVLEGFLKYRGVKVRVKSSHTGISWKPVSTALPWCLELAALTVKVPYDEVLGAWSKTNERTCSCFCRREHVVIVAALQRPRRRPNDWEVHEHKLIAQTAEQAKEWVAAINSALQLCYDRPRNLLVFINPYSGRRKARQVWAHEAAPVFAKAGIKSTVIETLAADHATNTLATMKADELALYQGVVAVGGDGVFQECVMGLLAQRARGGKNAAVASRLRLGHIPGGSTDAVAYTLHGTRSAEASALHIALGDRLSLDVARVDCLDPAYVPHMQRGQPAAEAAATPASKAGGNSSSSQVPPRYTPPPPSPGVTAGGGGLAGSGAGSLSPAPTAGDGAHLLAARSPTPGLAAGAAGPAMLSSSDPRVSGTGTTGTHLSPSALKSLTTRHFVCQAAYGFLGDVMHFSEGLRCLGPSRYDVSGAIQFLRLRSYHLTISYRPARTRGLSGTHPHLVPGATDAPPLIRVCSHPCEVCRIAGIDLARSSFDDDPLFADLRPASAAAVAGAAHTVSGGGKPGGPPPHAPDASPPPPVGDAAAPLPPTAPSLTRRSQSGPVLASLSAGLHGLAAGTAGAGQLGSPTDRSVGGGGGASGAGAALAPTLTSVSDGAFGTAAAAAHSAGSAAGALHGSSGRWVTVQGEYVSVMAVVTPCRSDKSVSGILPHAHLSDGRIYLVLVSKCSRLDYLRFLIRLSSEGLHDKCFPFVQVIPVTAACIRPVNGKPESCWNVDGELLPVNNVRMRVQRGLVDVFARGVEQPVFKVF